LKSGLLYRPETRAKATKLKKALPACLKLGPIYCIELKLNRVYTYGLETRLSQQSSNRAKSTDMNWAWSPCQKLGLAYRPQIGPEKQI